MEPRHTRCQAVILQADRILLVKHFNHHTQNVYWWLPGGGVKEDETPEAGVIREVKEETQLDVTVQALLSQETDDSRQYTYESYLTYLCQPQTYEARSGREHESSSVHAILDVAWFPLWDEQAWMPGFYEPHLYKVLKSLQAQLSQRKETDPK